MTVEKNIVKLDASCSQQLCSGQGIPSLSAAVKELLENSLDAGSTKIDITLRSRGLSAFEVSDNGNGVSPTDFDTLCKKHCTSKIQNFEDLFSNLVSYGFRGEALSNLCALSQHETKCRSGVSIITSSNGSGLGSRLEFDFHGTLIKKNDKRRERGTTVIVEGLFKPLPVRRRELERTINNHFRRTVALLEAYALITTKVRINLVDFSKGKRNVLLSTKGNDSIKENLVNILGHKFLGTLQEVNFQSRGDQKILLEGWISKPQCASSFKPSVITKQLVFINNRPVSYRKMSSLINNIWSENNLKGKCSFVLCVKVPAEAVDVNVTPDKQKVFLKQEVDFLSKVCEVLNEKLKVEEIVFHTDLRQQQKISAALHSKPPVSVSEDIVPVVEEHKQIELNSSEAKTNKLTTSKRKAVRALDFGSVADVIAAFSKRCKAEEQRRDKSAEDARLESETKIFEAASFKNADIKVSNDVLETSFARDDFIRFSLVGQFNLGFLVANKNDNLFIFDQHAADEIRRFEMLINELSVKSQRLVAPIKVDLASVEKGILSENMDVIKKLGFEITEQKDSFFLESVPVAVKSQLGVEDLKAIISDLGNQSSALTYSQATELDDFDIAQMPRLRAQFAMRACRGAIMIGTALKEQKQCEVIKNLHGLRKPFNCPHGRPTMRHLVSLQQVYTTRTNCMSTDGKQIFDSDRSYYFDPMI